MFGSILKVTMSSAAFVAFAVLPCSGADFINAARVNAGFVGPILVADTPANPQVHSGDAALAPVPVIPPSENAWDFNSPDGVPGFRLLSPAESERIRAHH